jgi:ribosomal protein L3 glutamine methyltransferase
MAKSKRNKTSDLPRKKHFAEALATLETPRDYIRWAVSRFHEAGLYFGHGTDNAWDEARYLVMHCLHMSWSVADQWLDTVLTLSERKAVISVLKLRLIKRLPAPYITGEAWFCGLPFYVNQQVLIPRSPIGEMIEKGFFPWRQTNVNRVLDLCCGSGCIGIAAAYQFPEAQVVLSDLSPDALKVAQINIKAHELEDQVACVQGDLFEGIEGTFDIILTNPPYVDHEDMASLPPEFQHEPVMALEAGFDGLDLVRNILLSASTYLADRGLLIVEVGNSWEHLEHSFPDVPFTWVEFEKGGHGVFVLLKEELEYYQAAFAGKSV